MTAKELAELVLRTLAAQQTFFKTRSRDDLIASKELEKQLKEAAQTIVRGVEQPAISSE
jgi:hypothetical protein